MFNLIYKFLKKPIFTPSKKGKLNLFLAKDLRQYRIEYFKVINYLDGKRFPLANKSIDYERLKIKKLASFLFKLYIAYNLYIFIFYL